MKDLTALTKFFLTLAKTQTILTRKFDGKLGGLSMSEFMILSHLHEASGEKLRRVDLADKVGLTASGITRILLPMEKIGLIKKETNERDARSSYVLLASGGKGMLTEAIERAELFSQDILPNIPEKKLEEMSDILNKLSRI
ncbi:MAG: MarR family winged helix-turn-helix transcriptional regulator [Candidatus Gracilibacteria bacterium]